LEKNGPHSGVRLTAVLVAYAFLQTAVRPTYSGMTHWRLTLLITFFVCSVQVIFKFTALSVSS